MPNKSFLPIGEKKIEKIKEIWIGDMPFYDSYFSKKLLGILFHLGWCHFLQQSALVF